MDAAKRARIWEDAAASSKAEKMEYLSTPYSGKGWLAQALQFGVFVAEIKGGRSSLSDEPYPLVPKAVISKDESKAEDPESFVFRLATESDIDGIIELVNDLAVYEKAPEVRTLLLRWGPCFHITSK